VNYTKEKSRTPWPGSLVDQFIHSSSQQQARFPADAFGRGAELFQGAILDLADALLADAQEVADLATMIHQHKEMREVIAEALHHNYINDPENFPASLTYLRFPPKASIKNGPASPDKK